MTQAEGGVLLGASDTMEGWEVIDTMDGEGSANDARKGSLVCWGCK